ncbi:FIST signal transduction protein [Winogradskyella bathintestinalis]|uniref:FIST C-terminal domain-containing protein n=1 Tax=Winogradskyella bathintestinalis TaxID=3035208 RepID=A0ABT7ZQH2_9FLAO|nr:FIST N-terminal domain-containing protein [Winogradskyella bathintestinalis]MDN3491251.1 FIST C-terminal domain-containing protein [Winogradskyella bathintestinalis]
MRTVQLIKQKNDGWKYLSHKIVLKKPLVLVFGDRYELENDNIYEELRQKFPDGHIVFASSCGDITTYFVTDNSVVATAIEFEKTKYEIKTCNILKSNLDSFITGKNLINQLTPEGLKHVLVISEGSFINGSELTKGMNNATANKTLITGGLCGDGDRFEKTLASYNEKPKPGEIVAIGFYGDTFDISFAIHGGWSPFGPERVVTKSESNILYELDGQPALDLYKKYLGEKSKELPSAALLYPLNVKTEEEQHSFVRTIINIEEENNAMVLAGHIPENSTVQLMMTNIDNIANASELAAKQALKNLKTKPQLAILVSCIGRKLVLDQRVEEEIEEVVAVLGEDVTLTGFYSYGEIAPFNTEINCQLHNQTMTITLMSE